jgi:hypothetical protein
MKFLRSLVAGIALAVLTSGAALAQCGTTAPANKFCGNDTGSSALATWKSIPPTALSPIPGGTVLGNRTGASAVPTPVTNPVLGIPGTSTGEVGLAGSTSGTAILRAQAAAGSAVSLLPTAAGTLVSTASSPLAIDPASGQISITGLAGSVLAGSGPAFTPTPTLGVPGVAMGTLGFAGPTSGTVTVVPQTVAGTPTLTLPNTSGTFAVGASTPLVLSATTGGLTCPTCVTSSGGGAITGTAPINVSAAGVVSINAPYTTLTASNGGIVYSGATNLAILAGTATAGQMLRSGASAAPSWSTATWPATTTANQLLYSSAANTVAGLATANGALLNTSASGVPALTANPVLGVAGTTVGSIGFQNATSGTVTLQPVTGALGAVTINIPAAAGTMAVSASAPLALSAAGNVTCATCATTTNGGALSATAPITLSAGGTIGVTGSALTKVDDTNVTLTLGGSPSTALLAATSLTLGWTGQLGVARGGTGLSAGTSGGLLYFSGTGTMASSGAFGTTEILRGGGVGAAPTSTVCGTANTVLHGGTPPACSSVVYADIAAASIATTSQYFTGTASTLVPTSVIYSAETTTTYGTTTTFDFNTFINTAVTLTGNITTQTLSNVKAGQAGMITFIQDGTGGRTTVWNSIFKWAGGTTPTLSTAAGAVDILFYSCRSATYCAASLNRAFN